MLQVRGGSGGLGPATGLLGPSVGLLPCAGPHEKGFMCMFPNALAVLVKQVPWALCSKEALPRTSQLVTTWAWVEPGLCSPNKSVSLIAAVTMMCQRQQER